MNNYFYFSYFILYISYFFTYYYFRKNYKKNMKELNYIIKIFIIFSIHL